MNAGVLFVASSGIVGVPEQALEPALGRALVGNDLPAQNSPQLPGIAQKQRIAGGNQQADAEGLDGPLRRILILTGEHHIQQQQLAEAEQEIAQAQLHPDHQIVENQKQQHQGRIPPQALADNFPHCGKQAQVYHQCHTAAGAEQHGHRGENAVVQGEGADIKANHPVQADGQGQIIQQRRHEG